MKILANDGIAASGISKLEAAGFTVITEKVEQEQLINNINEKGYIALLVRSATTARKELIDACPNLKLIGRGGVGMDNIDVEYARSKNIKVINTPGASSQSVAELVFAHLFSTARSLYDSNRQMPVYGNSDFKVLKKKYGKGIELRDKTIGIIGLGRIGQNVAKYALGCGMKVIGYDPYVTEMNIQIDIHGSEGVFVNIPSSSLDTLLANSNFITIHVPKQADGSAVIGEVEFAKMKKGAIIVNAARGGVINEDALIEALNNEKIAHAALDVYENEPSPREDLLKHPRISLTPHVGAATTEAQERIGIELAEQIITYFNSSN